MNKAIRYRLYPTEQQQEMFIKTFGCCRKIYNLMLADKIKAYRETGKLIAVTPAMYKDEYPFLREVDSLALANKQINLQEAFSSHFNKKRKKANGFPKFKSAKRSRKSYTTNYKRGTTAVGDGFVKLPKVGIVKAEIHRKPESDWLTKSATVSQESDGKFYVSVLFEYNATVVPVLNTDNAIGLDYASDGLYTDDQGNKGTNHKYYRESHDKLAKEQRKLSHMIESHIIGYRVIGKKRYPVYDRPLEECKNIQKQQLRVNRICCHIANQRKDNLHKLSTGIANRYDVVCAEDLDMKAISGRDFGNGKATMDNGYGMFLKMLEYKLLDRGKCFVKVDKWFPSSQLCHCCGTLHKEMKDLRIRTMNCGCGLSMNRDQNAAINIKNEGIRLLKQAA